METSTDLILRAEEPPIAGAMRVSDTLLQKAVRRIEHPTSDRAEDLHAVRAIIKQVCANLRLIKPVIGRAAFRKENFLLKKAAKLLGPMRDATVGLRALRELAKTASRTKERHLQTAFANKIQKTHTAVWEIGMRATVRSLEASRLRLRKLHIAKDDRQAMKLGLEKVYRACRRRMKRAFANGSGESFHHWRVRLQNLSYELQLLTPVWPGRLRSMRAHLERLQNLIGADHDLTVLKTALRKRPERFGGAMMASKFLRELKKRSRALRRDSRPLAAKVLMAKPNHFARDLDRHWAKWSKPPKKLKSGSESRRRGRAA